MKLLLDDVTLDILEARISENGSVLYCKMEGQNPEIVKQQVPKNIGTVKLIQEADDQPVQEIDCSSYNVFQSVKRVVSGLVDQTIIRLSIEQ